MNSLSRDGTQYTSENEQRLREELSLVNNAHDELNILWVQAFQRLNEYEKIYGALPEQNIAKATEWNECSLVTKYSLLKNYTVSTEKELERYKAECGRLRGEKESQKVEIKYNQLKTDYYELESKYNEAEKDNKEWDKSNDALRRENTLLQEKLAALEKQNAQRQVKSQKMYRPRNAAKRHISYNIDYKALKQQKTPFGKWIDKLANGDASTFKVLAKRIKTTDPHQPLNKYEKCKPYMSLSTPKQVSKPPRTR